MSEQLKCIQAQCLEQCFIFCVGAYGAVGKCKGIGRQNNTDRSTHYKLHCRGLVTNYIDQPHGADKTNGTENTDGGKSPDGIHSSSLQNSIGNRIG